MRNQPKNNNSRKPRSSDKIKSENFGQKKTGKVKSEEKKSDNYSKRNIGKDNNKPQYKTKEKPVKKISAKNKSEVDDGLGIRLNRYLANAGISSRREADTLISTGVVSINGKIVTELGVRVMPGDEVRFNGEKVNPEKKRYILLNKPKDYVTTLDDPQGRKTVMDLIKGACSERVYPVGRLDRNTTGLLLLTNDGELTKKLTHPKHNKKKIYHVVVDGPVKIEDLEKIAEGFELEDGFISADKIDYVAGTQNEIGIELHSGRNRIVRRIFEHLGYNIKRLDRVYFAGLTKLNLPRGKWRFLSEKEIIRLKTGMYE